MILVGMIESMLQTLRDFAKNCALFLSLDDSVGNDTLYLLKTLFVPARNEFKK